MTALPTDPWTTATPRSGTPGAAGSPAEHTAKDAAEDVCISCGVVFAWRDGWDGECLGCAVLSQEHLGGRHDGLAVAECRRCC